MYVHLYNISGEVVFYCGQSGQNCPRRVLSKRKTISFAMSVSLVITSLWLVMESGRDKSDKIAAKYNSYQLYQDPCHRSSVLDSVNGKHLYVMTGHRGTIQMQLNLFGIVFFFHNIK